MGGSLHCNLLSFSSISEKGMSFWTGGHSLARAELQVHFMVCLEKDKHQRVHRGTSRDLIRYMEPQPTNKNTIKYVPREDSNMDEFTLPDGILMCPAAHIPKLLYASSFNLFFAPDEPMDPRKIRILVRITQKKSGRLFARGSISLAKVIGDAQNPVQLALHCNNESRSKVVPKVLFCIQLNILP